jgi:hypothetical protein
VVDRLLASPHYGERWGRHWLDLVRYADTAGDNADFPVPDAYKYRNYVIESFNRDTPYDEFVREQVAGDLLPAASEEVRRAHIVATGYLALCRRFGSHAEEFHLSIEDVIDNAGKTFLGLSVSCARCHDHKFDPIAQADYYALYGIFESTRFAFPGTEGKKRPKDFIALGTPEEAEVLKKFEDERYALALKVYRFRGERERFEQSGEAKEAPGGRTIERINADLADALETLRKLEEKPPAIERAFAVAEGKPHDAKVHKKGDPAHRGETVPRGFLQVLGGQRLPDGSTGSGRLELAHWLTDPSNSLTARVMVNRIWQHHFGRGIVGTPNDFGARGRPPTHPELLDWLASRFVADGWSIKAMHRRLMLTRAYQLSGDDDPTASVADPANELHWRSDRRRLSAEEIRDAMLAVSGSLDPTPGGPHPFPTVAAWTYTQHEPFVADYDTNRRSIYLFQQRLRRHPYLEIFDGADTAGSVAVRPLSTTAIQALYLMNAPFVHEQADALAVRVGLASGAEADRIDYAYRLAFGRPPSGEEVEDGRAYLRARLDDLEETAIPADRRIRAALASLMRVLLSSNEFLFVD